MTPFEDLRQDLRFSLRSLRSRPAYAAAAVLTLALGIGAATAVFSVVDGVLLKPLPVEDEDRLLVVWKAAPERGFEQMPFSYASFEALRERLRTVSGLAAHPYHGSGRASARIGDEATPLQLTGVTGDFFEVLGAQAAAGRLIGPEDDRRGSPPVLVLSRGAADRLFGSAANALGRTVTLFERTFSIVGITPSGFEYPRGADAWTAATPLYTSDPLGVASLREATRVMWYLVARVGPGRTVEQARTELAAALEGLETESPLMGRQYIRAPSFTEVVVGDVRPALLLLAGAVLLVLLVGGVNLANLLLVRGMTRRRELTVRAALGASRARVFRQLATEAAVLVVLGAALGVAVALGGLEVLLAMAPPELPRLDQVGLDTRALGFTAAVAVGGAVLFGMLPGLRSARLDLGDALRGRGGSGEVGPRGYWLRHGLVVGQLALTALVLSLAGLLLKSLDRMQGLAPGFAPEDVVLVEVDIPPSRYPAEAAHQRAMAMLAERAAALPGVHTASAVLTPPYSGNAGFDAIWYAEGQDLESSPYANYEGADPRYFETLGLDILSGRGIDDGDREGTRPVVVVNESFARTYWPGEDPVGRRLKLGTAESPDPWRTVVGVVVDARYRELTEVRPSVYVPYGQGIPVRPRYIALRTAVQVSGVAGEMRRLVREQEPGASVLGITPLPRLLSAPLARPRFQSALMVAFALLGLVLSVIGTYGVLAFFVRQRAREIAIRVALGAEPARVRRLVLGHGMAMGVLGVVLGLAGALAAGTAVESLLFGVDAADPTVLGLTALTLLLACGAAGIVPTRAALRVDPAAVIRSE